MPPRSYEDGVGAPFTVISRVRLPADGAIDTTVCAPSPRAARGPACGGLVLRRGGDDNAKTAKAAKKVVLKRLASKKIP